MPAASLGLTNRFQLDLDTALGINTKGWVDSRPALHADDLLTVAFLDEERRLLLPQAA